MGDVFGIFDQEVVFMKKIIYIAMGEATLERAHSIQTFYTCKYLADKYKIKILYPSSPTNIKNSKRIRELYKNSRLKLKFIPKTFFTGILRFLDMHFGRCFFYITDRLFFCLFTFLYILLNSNEIDIIYTKDPVIAFFFSNSKKIHGKKVIYEIHKLEHILFDMDPSTKQITKKIEISSLNKSDYIIAITNWLKTYGKIFNKKVSLIPDAFDSKLFKVMDINFCRKKIGIPKDDIILMYSGINLRQGINNLITSIKYLKKDRIYLYIVGGLNDQIKRIKELSKNLGIINRIKFTGQVLHDSVPFYLNSADILILPYSRDSFTMYFSSPLKLFEYMSVKKPIVATNIESIKSYLNENNSVLVELDKPLKLAKGIERVLKNKELAKKISENVYKDSKKYSFLKRSRKIKEVIDKLSK